VLGFPLTELIENRDYPGSSHFFFDIGNGNLLAFFDFPGLDVGAYAEVLGGLHHLAISVAPERWQKLVERLTEAGVQHEVHSGVSVYFRDLDGARIELIADPLVRCTAITCSDGPTAAPRTHRRRGPGQRPAAATRSAYWSCRWIHPRTNERCSTTEPPEARTSSSAARTSVLSRPDRPESWSTSVWVNTTVSPRRS
jgi:hypothetical protein